MDVSVLLLFLSLALSLTSCTTILYVGPMPTGNGSTAAKPTSLSLACRLAVPGTTILLADGIYRSKVYCLVNGSAAAPVIISSSLSIKSNAILEGADTRTQWNAVLAINGSHVVVRGLVVRSSTGVGISVFGSDISIEKCIVYNTSEPGIRATGENISLVANEILGSLARTSIDARQTIRNPSHPMAAIPEAVVPLTNATVLASYGFEGTPSPSFLPSGLCVLGNRTIDNTTSHSGNASLLLHHLPGAETYLRICQATVMPVRSVGIAVTVGFWAKTDVLDNTTGPPTVNTSHFALFPYGGTSGYWWNAGDRLWAQFPDADWHYFSVTGYEGIDFYFGTDLSLNWMMEVAYDYPTGVTVDKRLWIDDLTVTVSPSNRARLLPDFRTVPGAPLQHRLARGSTASLAIVVDLAAPTSATTMAISGVSFHKVNGDAGVPFNDSGSYVLPHVAGAQDALRSLQLPLTRIYALGDISPTRNFTLLGAIDRVAMMLDDVHIPQETTVLELESIGTYVDGWDLSPATWAAAVNYSISRGYRFRYWEIGNEVWNIGIPLFAFSDWAVMQNYVDHFVAVAAAIRQVQPSAQVGISLYSNPTSLWTPRILHLAAGHYDFVVPHWYCGVNLTGQSTEDVVLGANFDMLNRVAQLKAAVDISSNGHGYQYDTEWGMTDRTDALTAADDRFGNIVGSLHRAVRMIYYARENLVKPGEAVHGITWNGTQGVHALPIRLGMLHWLYVYFNRHIGPVLVDFSGTSPWYSSSKYNLSGPATPTLITMSANRSIVLIQVVNGLTNASVPCSISLRNFIGDSSSTTHHVLTQQNLSGPALLPDWTDPTTALRSGLQVVVNTATNSTTLSFVLPPHSIVFLTIPWHPPSTIAPTPFHTTATMSTHPDTSTHPTTSTPHPTTSTPHPTTSTPHPTTSTLHPDTSTPHPTTSTPPHPTTSTLHPDTSTPHPTTSTPHPTTTPSQPTVSASQPPTTSVPDTLPSTTAPSAAPATTNTPTPTLPVANGQVGLTQCLSSADVQTVFRQFIAWLGDSTASFSVVQMPGCDKRSTPILVYACTSLNAPSDVQNVTDAINSGLLQSVVLVAGTASASIGPPPSSSPSASTLPSSSGSAFLPTWAIIVLCACGVSMMLLLVAGVFIWFAVIKPRQRRLLNNTTRDRWTASDLELTQQGSAVPYHELPGSPRS